MLARNSSGFGNETPISNTGLGRQEVNLEAAVDYFMCTSYCHTNEELDDLVKYVVGFFNQVLVWQDGTFFSGKRWDFHGKTLDGLRIAYSFEDDGSIHVWFSIPGKVFHLVDLLSAFGFLVTMRDRYGVISTRIDLKLRDYARRKMPKELWQEAEKGNVARIKKWGHNGDCDCGDEIGGTAYLGSRKSDRFLRVYDAQPVHEVDAIDWELQCRKKYAELVFSAFTDISKANSEDISELISKYIAATVLGFVDFIDRRKDIKDNRISRQPRQIWWQEFIDEAGGQIRHSLPSPSHSVQKSIKWLQKQVVVVMSALREGVGKESFDKWLFAQMDSAVNRFQLHHQALIHECSRFSYLKS